MLDWHEFKMKRLELLKFPTHKTSFSFNFFFNFYSSACSLSPLGGTFLTMGTVISVMWVKLSKIPTSDLKLFLQNGVRGEVGIVSIWHILNCQRNDYWVNTQCGRRVVLIMYLRWKITFKHAPLHLQAAAVTPTCCSCTLGEVRSTPEFSGCPVAYLIL